MQLLEYENQIFLELIEEDGLVIMAKGLGIERILLSLIKVYNDPGNLILVIGTSPQEEAYFLEQLETFMGIEELPKTITSEYGTKERWDVYMAGGVFFVTSRILVVDMLMDRVPIDLITGIIVYKAHRIIDSCQEAFILRLYRTKNKKGFIKALSSNPCAFTRGFCQIQRVMRNLFVKKLYLWPRFHAVVSSTFEKHKPDVDEIHITMTPAMQSIQLALLDIMNVCVKEIKKLNKTLDTEEVTVENAISKSFDKVIKYQLDPIWHQLGPKTHRLISDLKTLRTILTYLTQYDCVTFYNLLKSIRENVEVNASISDWLFMDVAENMFVHSKERLFGKLTTKKLIEDTNEKDLCLEDNPKWLILSEILAEIKENTESYVNPAVVLILTEDDHTRQQLKEFLCKGAQQYLNKLYNNSLKRKISKLEKSKCKKIGIKRKESEYINDSSSQENDSEEEDKEKVETAVETKEEASLTSPLTIIQALHGNDPFSLQRVLQSNEPNFIILYDTDINAIRVIEMYQAVNPQLSVKVYFLIYGGSAEEQRYLTSLRKEKEAFEFLIREKSVMAVPEERDGKTDNHPDLIRNVIPANETVNPRKGGGQINKIAVQHKVIVDLREFRSELPSLIHHRGIDIDPVTLEVGDYVLTPDMCVERKSLSDLIGSLNSGRLYNQVQSMNRYYKKPILLIEFDQNKPFSLQGKYYLSNEVSSQNVSSKLILLTLHFPHLRILWCHSPYATAEIFEILKHGKEQPQVDQVVKVTDKYSSPESSSDKYNAPAQDFLSRMPGINSKNIHLIMNKVKNIADLVSLTLEQLTEILENSSNAKLLYESIHHSAKRNEEQYLSNKRFKKKK